MRRFSGVVSKIGRALADERRVVILLLIVVGGLLFWDLRYSDLGFLPLHSIDEYVFHGSIRHMYDSAVTLNISGLFGFGFYQYGFGYFLLNMLMAAPFFAVGYAPGAVVVPRLVSSLGALGGLSALYFYTKSRVGSATAFLVAVIMVTMPAFWLNAAYFHPDWPMTAFLLLATYLLSGSEKAGDRKYWWAVLFYAVAVSVKYQVVTFSPLFFLFVFSREFRERDFSEFARHLVTIIKTGLAVVVFFFVTNLYIFHPMGWKVFYASLVDNLKSNATNHGSAEAITFLDKLLTPIDSHFLVLPLFFIVVLAAGYYSYRYFRSRNAQFAGSVGLVFLLNLGYLLIFVNKAWHHYYLPVFGLGLFLLGPFLQRVIRGEKWRVALLWFAIGTQLLFGAADTYVMLGESRDATTPDFNDWSLERSEANSDFIVGALLENEVESDDVILITPYTGLHFEDAGLDYMKVRSMFGCPSKFDFDKESYIDSQKRYWGEAKTREEIAESYLEKDFIIVRKNIPFIDTDRLSGFLDPEPCWEAHELYMDLVAGEGDYDLVAENGDVYVLKLRSDE